MIRFFSHSCASLIKHPQYSKHFCPACLKESPDLLSCINFFSLYLFPQSYTIDKPQLSARYKSMQSILHPDILKSKGIDNQDYSKLLQDAYKTLIDDIMRAKYILSLYNQDPEINTINDFEFLDDQIEKRQTISYGSQEEVLHIYKQVKVQTDQLKDRLRTALDQFDWETAKELIAKLVFLDKLEQEAKEKIHDF